MSNLEGSIFAGEIDESVVDLHTDLIASGHYLGLVRDDKVKGAVYRVGRRAVVGEDQIRVYFGLSKHGSATV